MSRIACHEWCTSFPSCPVSESTRGAFQERSVGRRFASGADIASGSDAEDQIQIGYYLIDVTYLSATELVVIYAASRRHPNCQ